MVTASLDGIVRLWQGWKTTSGKSPKPIDLEHGEAVTALAFSHDGKYLATGSSDNTGRVWEITSRSPVALMIHKNGVNAVAFSPDGMYVATGSLEASTDGTACVWEESSSKKTCVQTGEHLVAMDFSRDGKYLAVANGDKTARILLWKQEDLINKACEHLTSNLTHEQWKQYLGNEQPRKTCPNLHLPL